MLARLPTRFRSCLARQSNASETRFDGYRLYIIITPREREQRVGTYYSTGKTVYFFFHTFSSQPPEIGIAIITGFRLHPPQLNSRLSFFTRIVADLEVPRNIISSCHYNTYTIIVC